VSRRRWTTNKIISMVVLGVAAVMSLLAAILTITLWSDASGVPNRARVLRR